MFQKQAFVKQYAELHFVVILLGITGILGALISTPAAGLVWYRMFLASVGLWLFLVFRKIPFRITLKKQLQLCLIGVIVALHWITFFHAIKVSNVSVTLGVFASTTLFTSILEPVLQKRRVFWLEVMIGLVILFGIYLIFRYEFHYLEGILYSLLSALLNGLFVVLNRNISLKYHSAVISFYEMLGGFLFITIFFGASGAFSPAVFEVSLADVIYLAILSFLCTSYAFLAIVRVMKVLSAYSVVLAVNLEPVYGIILAHFFFPEAERMSVGFYLGAGVILLSVFSYPYLDRKFRKKPL